MAVDLMQQVAQMLKLAESTNHEEEAELIWGRLQVLASRHQIDLARAEQLVQKQQRREEPTSKTVHIADKSQRERRFYVDLFLDIARANDVVCDIASNATYVVCYGFPSDIELVEVLYASLVQRMVADASAYIKSGEYKNELYQLPVKRRIPNPDYGVYGGRYGVPKYDYVWETVEKPLSPLTVRRNFYEGFSHRISKRLNEARREAVKAAVQEEAAAVPEQPGQPEQPGAELVLMRKAEEVGRFYRRASNARGSYSSGSISNYSTSARAAGSASASSAHLGQASREIGGSRVALGRSK